MHVLIVEDEWPTAEDIQLLTQRILGQRLTSIKIETTLVAALDRLERQPIDVLLLDLNLHGRDGFDVLKNAVSRSFHTIIISANTDRALEAFEYGVLDFVAKPYSLKRLTQAFGRLEESSAQQGKSIKHLAVRRGGSLEFIPIESLIYIKGADVCAALHLKNGRTALSDKTLTQLGNLLPPRFRRIHKSYIVDLSQAAKLHAVSGGKYHLELHNGENLPVSRKSYPDLKDHLTSRLGLTGTAGILPARRQKEQGEKVEE